MLAFLFADISRARREFFALTNAMAVASSSFTLLRYSLSISYAAASRAFSAIRTSPRVSLNYGSIKFLLPIQSRRSLSCIKATNDEEASAKAAAASADSGAPTIFDKIIAKEIPSTIVYENEKVLAFRDINPQAPVHVVVIPKFRDGLTQLGKAEARHGEILGELLYAAKIVAEKEGILDGFRVVINNGPEACQSVYHLHLHVLGGRQMKWPPG
ncbi:zinc-binding family protein [Tripterygium wilfordii]|uniref:Zinc-binding family protein n=1 Tax=Tripterygium wilfordii TaxID=458696 RepID=A0A7J7D7S5_TRIWF|nr:14 kDa zinc-binding protein isoform X1 [Tripterygium wilfordii]KAF5742361.1 zinc-binding family protein [Tripterygium wilfordii]